MDSWNELDILYEDNHLLAVFKPAGLLTQDSGRGGANLEDMARMWIRHTKGKPGNVFLHAVHRLDRPVSGIALFAKTGKALGRMNEQLRKRTVRKVYHAVVTGDPPAGAGTLVHALRHSRMRSVEAAGADEGSRRCALHYRILRRSGGLVLLEMELETGRYHQIRAQLGLAGCPILGDRRYGGRQAPGMDGIALHHRLMEFIHPTTGAQVSIQAPYPVQWPLAVPDQVHRCLPIRCPEG
jgi:23S rRNA pseudouridine1911/1915/1917 synthase